MLLSRDVRFRLYSWYWNINEVRWCASFHWDPAVKVAAKMYYRNYNRSRRCRRARECSRQFVASTSWHWRTATCKRFCFHYRHAALTIKQERPPFLSYLSVCLSLSLSLSLYAAFQALNSRGIRCLYLGTFMEHSERASVPLQRYLCWISTQSISIAIPPFGIAALARIHLSSLVEPLASPTYYTQAKENRNACISVLALRQNLFLRFSVPRILEATGESGIPRPYESSSNSLEPDACNRGEFYDHRRAFYETSTTPELP